MLTPFHHVEMSTMELVLCYKRPDGLWSAIDQYSHRVAVQEQDVHPSTSWCTYLGQGLKRPVFFRAKKGEEQCEINQNDLHRDINEGRTFGNFTDANLTVWEWNTTSMTIICNRGEAWDLCVLTPGGWWLDKNKIR